MTRGNFLIGLVVCVDGSSVCRHSGSGSGSEIIIYFFKALHQVALSSLQCNRELKTFNMHAKPHTHTLRALHSSEK